MATLTFSQLCAQGNTEFFEANNFRWAQSTNGLLFYDEPNVRAGFEVPVGGGNHTLFVEALMVSGITLDADTLIIAGSIRQNMSIPNRVDVWGPLKNDLSANDPMYIESYNRFWYVTKEQILLNEAYFDCVYNPNCDASLEFSAYQIPEVFQNWPAMGDTTLGYAAYLAPFFDRNGDGVYQPNTETNR